MTVDLSIVHTKDSYLDTMELAFNCYTRHQIEHRVCQDGKTRLDLHSYSRILTVLGCLISAGRLQELQPLWEHMMTESCRELSTLKQDPIADFSIKEIMLALHFMGPRCTEDAKSQWLFLLSEISPYTNYRFVIRDEESKHHLHNINIYNMAGEFLREKEGVTDTQAYFHEHWPTQLVRFDENGMYRDPGNPMLYDLTTRVQIQLLLGLGYQGEFASAIDEQLRKSGLWTLQLQSAAFEHPFGGRSNQFLFNEILIAANAEYEAVRYARLGDLELAGAFKRSARLALASVQRWLAQTPARHIKNLYPIDSKYGTESYGFYDKYMITMGAFLSIAYLFMDDTLAEAPCPAEVGGYVIATSPSFHKVIANAAGYSVQIDTCADSHYDATGLGRIHRNGVPTELGLSVPFSAGDSFELREGIQRISAAIGPGWKREDGSLHYLSEYCDESIQGELSIIKETPESVQFAVTYSGNLQGVQAVKEHYLVHAEGVSITFELVGATSDELYLRVPLLHTNGKDMTSITSTDHTIQVAMNTHTYTVNYAGELDIKPDLYGNRNGEYQIAVIRAEASRATIQLALR
ncbi:hypothetical protein [Paenibacillus qinlingensis]|uniref:Uncharacterized protein n=1 Tax=Paenibacillus qinlingensis TaxID=1837343 RepID=A0ABU1NW49_9BACL|nr:hypothetical protein [Paenibacillus qinlingensis]MDR6551682.1 hypothetical protein [Paenibacillus qinlingensis]